MKCPKCSGNLKLIEEVSGSFLYRILDNGEVDYFDKEYYGDSYTFVECSSCEYRPDWYWNEKFDATIDIKEED